MTLRFVTGATIVLLCGLVGCAGQRVPAADVPAQQAPAPAPAAGATAPGEGSETVELSNTLRWATASEIDNYGFDVYRSETEDGTYACITDQPIAGAGTIDVPTEYAYVDDTIDPRKEYFYYVESISMDGQRARFTPIMRAAAKQ